MNTLQYRILEHSNPFPNTKIYWTVQYHAFYTLWLWCDIEGYSSQDCQYSSLEKAQEYVKQCIRNDSWIEKVVKVYPTKTSTESLL